MRHAVGDRRGLSWLLATDFWLLSLRDDGRGGAGLVSLTWKRLRYLAEVAVVFLLLAGVGLFWYRGNPTFAGATVHPYLILIVYMAVRYGWTEGVVASVLGS